MLVICNEIMNIPCKGAVREFIVVTVSSDQKQVVMDVGLSDIRQQGKHTEDQFSRLTGINFGDFLFVFE